MKLTFVLEEEKDERANDQGLKSPKLKALLFYLEKQRALSAKRVRKTGIEKRVAIMIFLKKEIDSHFYFIHMYSLFLCLVLMYFT